LDAAQFSTFSTVSALSGHALSFSNVCSSPGWGHFDRKLIAGSREGRRIVWSGGRFVSYDPLTGDAKSRVGRALLHGCQRPVMRALMLRHFAPAEFGSGQHQWGDCDAVEKTTALVRGYFGFCICVRRSSR
jgi:hypothetical protein